MPGSGGWCVAALTISSAIESGVERAAVPSVAMRSRVCAYSGFLNRSPSCSVSPVRAREQCAHLVGRRERRALAEEQRQPRRHLKPCEAARIAGCEQLLPAQRPELRLRARTAWRSRPARRWSARCAPPRRTAAACRARQEHVGRRRPRGRSRGRRWRSPCRCGRRSTGGRSRRRSPSSAARRVRAWPARRPRRRCALPPLPRISSPASTAIGFAAATHAWRELRGAWRGTAGGTCRRGGGTFRRAVRARGRPQGPARPAAPPARARAAPALQEAPRGCPRLAAGRAAWPVRSAAGKRPPGRRRRVRARAARRTSTSLHDATLDPV